jgi:hypothetical protein
MVFVAHMQEGEQGDEGVKGGEGEKIEQSDKIYFYSARFVSSWIRVLHGLFAH